jgi:hypothetical protein
MPPTTDVLRRCALIGALAVFVCAALRPVRAQTSLWTTPRRVSDESIMSWFPSLAADVAGGVHLAYASADPEDGAENSFDMIEYVSLDGDRPIGSSVDVMAVAQDAAGSYAGRPDLLVARNGDLLMTWRSRAGIWFTRAAHGRAADPLAWDESLSLGEGYFSRLVEESDGTLHVIYTSNVRTSDCAICFHVFHRRSDDRGAAWSTPVDVSVLPTGAARPQIALDRAGGLHVVWEMARGGDLGQTTRPRRVAHSASFDQGRTWTSVRVLSSDEAATPALAVDGFGALVVTWMGQNDDGFYFVRSSDRGRTWSLPARIEGATNTTPVYDARLDGQAAVVDGRGHVHWFAVGRIVLQRQGLSLLHAVWDGTAWSAPEVVTEIESEATGDVPQWPSAVVAGGNRLYVAWYLRKGELLQKEGEARRAYEVHFAVRIIDAPALAPIAYPTATAVPVPTASASPLVRAEPPSTPLASEVTDVSMQSLRSEGELWTAIALGVTPLLLAVPLAWWRRRRMNS